MTAQPSSSLLAVPNPFHGNVIIQDVWQKLSFDVTSIHQATFEACLSALDNVSKGRSDSVLIYGAPGSGKTHLLSRLQEHLFTTSSTAPDRVLRCVFVAVRLQTSPTQLWQHVRQRLASDLLRQEEGMTQLQRLVAHQLAAERKESPRSWVRNVRVLTSTGDESVTQHLQRVAERLDLGRDLFVILDHLVHGRFSFDAAAWLKGDGLQDLLLEKLGVARDEGEEREETARRIVTSLCRLAGETLPLVFCFDQLESLQRFSKDSDALYRFGRLAADLSDADDNVLIISCVQSAFVEEIYGSVREADSDRAFKRRSALEPLTREQMEMLVIERLQRVEELAPIRAAEPRKGLHPFDRAFIDDLYERTPKTPRKVIAHCADQFERLRSGLEPLEVNIPKFIEETFQARRRQALEQLKPEDSRQTLLHGLPLLWLNLRKHAQPTSLGELESSAVDVLLRGPLGDAPVLVCNERSMNGLAARLRRLVNRPDSRTGAAQPILLRDARLKITAGARRTREYLSTLERRGYGLIQPSVETLAALEGLRSLLSDARSGDLSVRGETVGQVAVERWLGASADRDLTRLIDDIEAERQTDPDAQLEQDLLERVLDQHVVSLDSLAKTLGCDAERIRAVAERRPDRFAVLQGPPAVLFAYVPDETIANSREAS